MIDGEKREHEQWLESHGLSRDTKCLDAKAHAGDGVVWKGKTQMLCIRCHKRSVEKSGRGAKLLLCGFCNDALDIATDEEDKRMQLNRVMSPLDKRGTLQAFGKEGRGTGETQMTPKQVLESTVQHVAKTMASIGDEYDNAIAKALKEVVRLNGDLDNIQRNEKVDGTRRMAFLNYLYASLQRQQALVDRMRELRLEYDARENLFFMLESAIDDCEVTMDAKMDAKGDKR